jgi:hypothetical protein
MNTNIIKGSAILLCLVVSLSLPVRATSDSLPVRPTTTTVALNGRNIPCAGYNIGGSNYFKLRDLLQSLDIHVAYDAAAQTIRIDSAKPYAPDGSEGKPAPSPATAIPATAKVTLNGVPMDWTAYHIGGANYFRLRDVMQALDVFVYYAAEFDLILLLTDRPYQDAGSATGRTNAPTPSLPPTTTPITSKTLDGNSLSREDFSRQANPAVFDATYTRGVYNLIRQIMVDYDTILAGTNADGFNPYYQYPHTIGPDAQAAVNSALNRVTAYRRYRAFGEPYVTNRWQYPGYTSATVQPANQMIRDADIAADAIIAQAAGMTPAEQMRFFNCFVRSRITYDATRRAATLLDIFAGTAKVPGVCSEYTRAFQYLCDKAGIPVMAVSGLTATGIRHSWNLVYVGGAWLTVDVTANIVLTNAYTFATDEDPTLTAFLKELLVPGSTR